MNKKFDINLEGKKLWDLQKLLKELKLYKDLVKKLWNRWKKIFKSLVENKSLYKVEYYPDMGEKNALEEAKKVYENIFSEKNVKDSDIEVKIKEGIDWWIRVFKNDELVDLSFKKVEKILK